jgi:hypothetical protein
MATNPRSRNNTDAALSAVEEALRLDFGSQAEDPERNTRRPPEPRAPETGPRADLMRRGELARRPEASRTPAPPRRGPEPVRSEPPRTEARRPEPAPMPPPREDARRPEPPRAEDDPAPQVQQARPRAAGARSRLAANDDRRGSIALAAYQRRPSRLIYPVAIALSLFWAVVVIGISLSNGVFSDGDFLSSARVLNTALFLFVPIGFLWAIASMIWRTQELRIVARSITDVAQRLSEPENIATDAVVNVSQAIRREVASVGDGIERALARASELELLVHNEVAALERSYSDNETRMRALIDDLAGQREAIVINSERVRTSIVAAQESLSKDLRIASESIAENVTHAGNRITMALSDRGEQITVALAGAGETMVAQLASRGEDLVNRLADTVSDVAESLAQTGAQVTDALLARSADINDTLETTGRAMADTIAERGREVNDTLARVGSELVLGFYNRTAEITR